MSVTIVHDAIHANIAHLPPGHAAGYTTGSSDIAWTAADWAAHPGAVRICQNPTASDHTADALDVEQGAATNAAAPGWYKAAHAAYMAGGRPGQRSPALYTSAANVTSLVNVLAAAGVTTGPRLWVANWSVSTAEAQKAVQDASGPYPVIGFQYASGQFYDTSVFSQTWLDGVSVTSGPQSHLTHAGDTIHSLAASQGMRSDGWLAYQRQLGADVAALASGPLKAGIEWRTASA